MRSFWIPAFWCVSLSTCAYPAPTSVGIFVNSFPPGASCAVKDGGEIVGQIDATPGIALVPNATRDYLLSCQRVGFQDASAVVHAQAEVRTFWQQLGSRQISAPGGASVNLALLPQRPVP